MKAFSIFLFCLSIPFLTLADTIVVNQTIRDGETIVSAQETFELGFFSPRNAPQNQYLAIWYKRLGTGTIGWVANRETPITNKSGELILDPNGVLVLRDSTTNRVIWSSYTNRSARNPVARLLDNGNLMVVDDDEGPENYVWQSFDHPGDTQLPGMKFGRNLERGIVTNYTSWKSDDDPSQGPYIVYMDFNGLPQIFQKNGDAIQYRLGSWNGFAFTGRPKVRPNSIYTIEYVSNEIETYTKGELINSSVLSRLTLTPEGNMGRFNWINRTQGWFLLSAPISDSCDRYELCGPYGSCDIEQSPPCGCLKGFTPRRPSEWHLADWSDGCQRTIPLDCGVNEGFRKYPSVKLPDTRLSWFDRNMTLEQCEVKCKNECNCTAYTTLDIKYGTGCLLWYTDLNDMRMFSEDGQDIYIRMAAAELERSKGLQKKKKVTIIVIIFVVIGFAIALGLCFLIVMKRKLKLKANGWLAPVPQDNVLDLPLFGLSTLLSATNNFSDENKLGEGGYGPVYKGLLEDGTEVAVKRLSDSSTQGVEEFKNEVIFISKLQHRNLVKLLGCCIEGEEKILVYEYMPNKGLDLLLFDETDRKTLKWSQRFHIINGIARGLLYLHQDSRLRIIHRDLKAANILLDHEMNPKISDFGLARSFGGNETETNTKRVIGTYGYMSPEYAGDGIFSVKSDVFSFGVLVLEIVSGKKNRRFFYQTSHSNNLLGHAWILYTEGKTLELVDESMIDQQLSFEVLRSIHVALLCVQHNPEDRPDMSMVVVMLSSENRLPEPRQPGFYTEDKFGPESSSSMQAITSNSSVTITQMEPR